MCKKSAETLKRRYGSDYFSRLGRKGGLAFWQKYHLIPVGAANFAIADRCTGEVKNYINGVPRWMDNR